MILAVVSYLATLIRFLTSQVAIISERVTLNSKDADYFCKTTLDATEVAFILCSNLIYVFYFARQHTLFTQQTMRQLNTKLVKFSAIILIVGSNIVDAVIYLLSKKFKTTDIGCIVIPEVVHGNLLDILRPMIKTLTQFMLLSFFIYPLLLHYFKSEKSIEIKPKL